MDRASSSSAARGDRAHWETLAPILTAGLALSSWGCGHALTPPPLPAVWSGPAQLQEIARIGGDSEGPEERLGFVSSVWGNSTETYIVDDDVRVYTAAGEYLRQIGRRGEGLDEYRDPVSVAVGPGDDVFVLEIDGGGVVHVYGPNGGYRDRWSYASAVTFNMLFFVDGAGDIYAPAGTWSPTGQPGVQLGFVRISADGTVHDSVLFEARWPDPDDPWALLNPRGEVVGVVPFAPALHWAVGPYGMTVTGDSSTNEVRISLPDASEPTVVTLGGGPVSIDPAEARYARALTTASRRSGWEWRGGDIPDVKPAHVGFRVAADSSVWVLRRGSGEPKPDCTVDGRRGELVPCWSSRLYADVFEPDGTYLGEVQIPDEIGSNLGPAWFIGSDFLLARVESAAGHVQVVRYAIVLPQ